MASKTDFDKNLIDKILAKYNIGEFKDSKAFKRGYVQTNILIKTTKNKYVLRYYENRDKKRVKFEMDILNFLADKKYPIAKPIPTKKNEYIQFYNRKPFVIFEYIQGKHLKNLNEFQFRELVHNLAKLHKITKSYDEKNYIHAEPRTKEYCLIAANIEKKRFSDKDEGNKRYNIIQSQLESINFSPKLRKGLIHGDFDKSNVKFNDNNVSGILDFDDSHIGYTIHDLGIIIMYWARFYNKKMDFNIAHKIIKYYEEVFPLNKIEKEHIFDAFKFAALIIMSWLMYDKWKGKDLFKILSKFLEELDSIGRKEFYKRIFKKS